MIEVDGLRKRFGAVEILRGVTLSVVRGEVAAIIGPSGSGKSTFLRCLNGLERFDAGRVEVDGLRLGAESETLPADWARVHRQVCRRVGMVFQSFNLFPHRTAIENVMEGPVYVLGLERSRAEERARRLLDRVGMADRLHALPRQLSGGQQQRVAIARALAMEPRAILFDEPTSALDPRMTAEVLAVMSDLAGDGLTMIAVTHAMHFARRVAHKVYVFGDGRVIESGPPEQIFEEPREEATRTLLSNVQAA
jgi:polar amino acid transport system ATP-binding protein